jgi:outer membrane biosynthesis protein TonB
VGSLVVQEVAAVLEANRPKIRRCASDRGQTGRVKITFTIAPKGHVTSATAEEVQGFDAAVVRCMVGQVKALRFAESSGDTKIRFPMLVTH